VAVSSAAVASGYIMGAPEDRNPFRNGQYLTGDLGCIDADGFLTIKSRLDQLINVGGLKVSPVEVQHVLECHPGVREAGVVGFSDEAGGIVITAYVVPQQAVTQGELQTWCCDRLADYKIPKRIHFIDELPRGPTGKVRLRPSDPGA
jgi:acyl-coenzyme A synthetase/AMP-(fatty) acid ligase